MLPINLDPELAKKFAQGMRTGDAIELPFPIVYIWALNGQASYKVQGGALYYGGWACKADELSAVSESEGVAIPQAWKQATVAARDGSEFEAYTTRSVLVAPFGRRQSWLLDGQRSPVYVEGGRRHVHVLAYLAEKKGSNGDSTYLPWGPIVLSAKGYQATNLNDAFKTWDKVSATLRSKVAPGVPAWCFYFALGTFDKERKAVNVGKPGAQSPITPISAYIPEKLTAEQMHALYVGEEVAGAMAELQDQAREWLDAWKQPGIEKGQEIPDYDAGPDNFGGDLDGIPF